MPLGASLRAHAQHCLRLRQLCWLALLGCWGVGVSLPPPRIPNLSGEPNTNARFWGSVWAGDVAVSGKFAKNWRVETLRSGWHVAGPGQLEFEPSAPTPLKW